MNDDIKRILGRLGAMSVFRAQIETELEKLWRDGVDKIRDPILRGMLISFLTEKVPPAFYIGAATSSGKHHPPWHNGPCGAVINTWECCLLVPTMAVSFPELVGDDRTPNQEAIDVALAATIVSDSFKWSVEGAWNGQAHLMLAVEAWHTHMVELGLGCHELAARALNGVFWHHGVFSPGWKPGVIISGECLLVHVVDAIMSKRLHSAPLHRETES